jgi:hypothetical protein
VSNLSSLLFAVIAVSACNVNAPRRPGGIESLDAVAPGDAIGSDGSAERCGRGVLVIEQGPDYLSTNVAALAMDGTVLQESSSSIVGLAPRASSGSI